MYNQRENRIEVIVRKEGGGASAGANEIDIDEVSAMSGEDNRGKNARSINRAKRILKTNATHMFAVTKQVAGLYAEYQISGLALQNGDQALQDQVSRKVEILEDATNLTTSVMQGITYGSWGGPIGTVLGASMAFISTGASLMSKYKRRDRDFSYKTYKQNNAIEYKRARAGINLTTGRLR